MIPRLSCEPELHFQLQYFWALQYIAELPSEDEADATLLALSEQENFLAGKTTPKPGAVPPHWKLQAFFSSDNGQAPVPGEQLPDGMRRVRVSNDMIAGMMGDPCSRRSVRKR